MNEVHAYIRRELKKGVAAQEITNSLLRLGHEETRIEQAFLRVSRLQKLLRATILFALPILIVFLVLHVVR